MPTTSAHIPRTFPRILYGALVLVLTLGLTACDSNDPADADDESPVTLSIATPAMTAGAPAKRVYDLTDADGNTLSLETVQLVVDEIEFEGPNDDRDDVEQGPFTVSVPLTGQQPQVALETDLPPGTYDEMTFEIEAQDDDDDGLDDDGRVLPEGTSIRVTGTYTPAGGTATAFTYTSDLDVEREVTLTPPLDITEPTIKNVTLVVNLDNWFRTSAGLLVDPAEANDEGRYEDLVEDNIEASFEGFEDDDRDGEEDDDDDDELDDDDDDSDD